MHADTYESPENKFISSERRKIVFNTINLLPEKNRNILLLYHDGLSYGEISEVLDIKITSVGKSVSRSIEKLKKLIKTNHNELFEK